MVWESLGIVAKNFSISLNCFELNESRKSRSSKDFSRFHINIGKKHEMNPARIIGLINDNTGKRNLDIGQIEILTNFSFFELEKS